MKGKRKELRRGAGTQILGGGNDEKADFEECVVGDGGCGVVGWWGDGCGDDIAASIKSNHYL